LFSVVFNWFLMFSIVFNCFLFFSIVFYCSLLFSVVLYCFPWYWYSRAERVQWRRDVGGPHPATVEALTRIKYSSKGWRSESIKFREPDDISWKFEHECSRSYSW
jgi:hypothetical protein